MLATCCLHAPTKQASPASLTQLASVRATDGRPLLVPPSQTENLFTPFIPHRDRDRSTEVASRFPLFA